jgi:hypothetical protein
MPLAFDKILISFGFILLLTLFIGTHAGLAYDVAYPDRLLVSIAAFQYLLYYSDYSQVNEIHSGPDAIHDMAKRRFLPTRRELHRYLNDDYSSESNEEDSHLNTKRYFLKSKRYFLNSK